MCKIKTGKLNANAKSEDGIYPFFTCDAIPFKINEYLYISEENMDKLLPPRSLFGAAGKNRQKERSEFYNEVIALFEKYLFQ